MLPVLGKINLFRLGRGESSPPPSPTSVYAPGFEGNMKEKCSVEKSRSLKSCKATLKKKKNCDKNQEKSNFLFNDRNDAINSYSNGDQNDTVKVMIQKIFKLHRKTLVPEPLF